MPTPIHTHSLVSAHKATYLAVWLTSWAAWTHHIHRAYASGSLPSATQTQWRKWLASSAVAEVNQPFAAVNRFSLTTEDPGNGMQLIVGATLGKNKGTGKAAARSKTKQEQAKEMFNLCMPNVKFPEQVYWKEKELQFGDSNALTPVMTAEILWELFKHNWHFELLALDWTIHFLEWRDLDWGLQRDAVLQKVFFGNRFLVGPMLLFDQGLAAESLVECLPYLCTFQTILISWPQAPQVWDDVSLGPKSFNAQQVLELEDLMASFYCQRFFNYIGWCPITPHHILNRKSQACCACCHPHHLNDWFVAPPFFSIYKYFYQVGIALYYFTRGEFYCFSCLACVMWECYLLRKVRTWVCFPDNSHPFSLLNTLTCPLTPLDNACLLSWLLFSWPTTLPRS